MKINVILTPSSVDELYFTGKTVVVIDVLRASSTIVTALTNGAKEFIPVGSVEFAMKASGSMFGGQTLLGGERNTKKIDGFNLGNSPLEYNTETISGKAVVLFTTNGSKTIVKTKFSEITFICSFLNLSAIANHLASLKKDFEIVCSGRNNLFSIEDTICAGKLIAEIQNLSEEIELTDSSIASVSLSKSLGKNIKKMLFASDHGKILLENGFEEDLVYCSKLNTTEIIPAFVSNSIKSLGIIKPDNGIQAG
jgi:2-phosphosulfolactate phosphatase